MKQMAQPAAQRRPLKQAIKECELRWFHETAALAKEGEANQMALLGHMYTIGYGCKPDTEQAQKWFAEASKRLGYNVLTDQPPLMTTAGPVGLQEQEQQQQQHQQQQQAATVQGSVRSSSSRSRLLRSTSQGGNSSSAVAGTLTPPPAAAALPQMACTSSASQL